MKDGKKINFCGYLIQKDGKAFYVLDWDYEGQEKLAHVLPFRTLNDAKNFVLSCLI